MEVLEDGEEDWYELYKKSAEGKLANYDQITDQIYIGGYKAAETFEVLNDIMKVSSILTVAENLDPVFPDKFKYKVIKITDEDSSDICQYFKECIAFISECIANKEIMLVHCVGGFSRSPSVVIAYFMYTQKLKFSDAFKAVKEKRPCIKPNPGFISQLQRFEELLICEGVLPK